MVRADASVYIKKNNIMLKNILIAALALLAAACGNTPSPADTATTTASETSLRVTAGQRQNAGIEVGRPERRSMRTQIQVNGTVDVPPQSLVSVSFPLGGYLKSTDLLPGLHVRKGQTLAVLEDPQYIQLQQDYLIARAKAQYAEAELARQQELQQGQAGSVKALQQAQAEHTAQQVLVKALAEKLLLIGINPAALDVDKLSRSVRVPSPIDGFVSAVHVNIGKYVNPTDVLFELVNPSDIHLNLKVFEKDVPALRVGQRISAHTSDRPADLHPGAIILISRNVSEERAVEAHCHFDRYDPTLLPGMFMTATVDVTTRDALAVPEDAVVRWESRRFVFVEKSDTAFELLEVDTGATADGYVQITPKDGADLAQRRLVLKNAYALLMQMKNTAGE